MNISASAKLLPGPISSITFSCPAGEMPNSLTWPVTVTWKDSHGSPTRKTMSPRPKRRSWQPAARRSSSGRSRSLNSGSTAR